MIFKPNTINSTLVDTIVVDQNIVKFGIFQFLSFIFESGEIRRFQGALMGSKTSVQTCFTVDLPLKSSILRSKTPIKVKGKS